MLLSKYVNFYLNTRKKYTCENLSFNLKIQTIYTTKLEFCTLYDIKENEIKCAMFKIKTPFLL